MFGKSTKLSNAVFKEGFLTQKKNCVTSRLQSATLTIFPNGLHIVNHLNEIYEVEPGNGPRYKVKDNSDNGYDEFLAIE